MGQQSYARPDVSNLGVDPSFLRNNGIQHTGGHTNGVQSVGGSVNAIPSGSASASGRGYVDYKKSVSPSAARLSSRSLDEKVIFDGPMKMLQSLGADELSEQEDHDPITKQILTRGEAAMAFRIYFEKCHPNAPFMDPDTDSDSNEIRTRNTALFLNIVLVGTRFWSQSSKRDYWLHPRYSSLVRLLDNEMSRLIFRPRPADLCLETVQALVIYAHWMPIDVMGGEDAFRSRFSEASAWQCLGLAIRWAVQLGWDKTAHLPFLPGSAPTSHDVRVFRTMIYLIESDHYLALSAHSPPSLSPTSVTPVLSNYQTKAGIRSSDNRLVSLLRVVQVSHVMGNRAESIECLEAFSYDVDEIEKEYTASTAGLDGSHVNSADIFGPHFPYISLRWYRLSFASTILPPAHSWRSAGKPLHLCVGWASEILFHLAGLTPTTNISGETVLNPLTEMVAILTYAIDQHFVVIAYTASFLVLAWQTGAIDNNLHARDSMETASTDNPDSRASLLYRLVDLATRTLRACSPTRGHLTTRYIAFLDGMATIVANGASSFPNLADGNQSVDFGNLGDLEGAPTDQVSDQDWLNAWHGMGMEPGWLFNADEGAQV